MSGRLDSSGVLHDIGWNDSPPKYAMDSGSRMARIRELCRRIGRPFTTDEALQSSAEDRQSADATLEKLIPGYSRLR
jgi:hypothetical protein